MVIITYLNTSAEGICYDTHQTIRQTDTGKIAAPIESTLTYRRDALRYCHAGQICMGIDAVKATIADCRHCMSSQHRRRGDACVGTNIMVNGQDISAGIIGIVPVALCLCSLRPRRRGRQHRHEHNRRPHKKLLGHGFSLHILQCLESHSNGEKNNAASLARLQEMPYIDARTPADSINVYVIVGEYERVIKSLE